MWASEVGKPSVCLLSSQLPCPASFLGRIFVLQTFPKPSSCCSGRICSFRVSAYLFVAFGTSEGWLFRARASWSHMVYFRFWSDLFYLTSKRYFICFRNETIFEFGKTTVTNGLSFNLSLQCVVLEKASVTGGKFMFLFLCTRGFSLCQHKMLAEASVLASGCGVVVTALWPAGILTHVLSGGCSSPWFPVERDLWVASPGCGTSQICSCALGTRAIYSIPERPGSAGQAICVSLRFRNTVFIKCTNGLFCLK